MQTAAERERLGQARARIDGYWAQRSHRAAALGHQVALGSATGERQAESSSSTGVLQAATVTTRSGGEGGESADRSRLPGPLRSGLEALSGLDLSATRVNYNSAKPAQLGARAYAQGKRIEVAPGEEHHLPHEGWHVVQQMQGRVQPTLRAGKVAINDEVALEREADAMGAKAVRQSEGGSVPVRRSSWAETGVVQRQEEEASPTAKQQLLATLALLEKATSASTETSSSGTELEAYLEDLREIAKGDDESLMAVAVEAIEAEAKKQAGSSIEDLVTKPQTEQEAGDGEVVQGSFLPTWLTGLFTSHPYIAYPALVVVLGLALRKVQMERKRKKLPPSAARTLFSKNRVQYWVYLKRFMEDFCKADGTSEKDAKNLQTAMLGALRAGNSENNFKYFQYQDQAAKLTWDDARLANRDYVYDHIFDPFDAGVKAVAAKKITTANVTSGDLAGFTSALKKMPFVQTLYSGKAFDLQDKSAKKKKQSKPMVFAGWKDGGKIDAKMKLVDDGNYLTRDRSHVDDGRMKKRLVEADRFIRRLVEPGQLQEVPRPSVAVHLRNASGPTRPWGFRAFQRSGEIHIAQDEPTSIIVHEIGHYIENTLPMEEWGEIQTLLAARAGGGEKAGYIYPWTLDEQRFPGSYPATGTYTSKLYASGHTEVMSMSVEYLADPNKFKQLIEGDPQQAALILRLLRPIEFNRMKALKPFVAKYLPT